MVKIRCRWRDFMDRHSDLFWFLGLIFVGVVLGFVLALILIAEGIIGIK